MCVYLFLWDKLSHRLHLVYALIDLGRCLILCVFDKFIYKEILNTTPLFIDHLALKAGRMTTLEPMRSCKIRTLMLLDILIKKTTFVDYLIELYLALVFDIWYNPTENQFVGRVVFVDVYMCGCCRL